MGFKVPVMGIRVDVITLRRSHDQASAYVSSGAGRLTVSSEAGHLTQMYFQESLPLSIPRSRGSQGM